MINYDLECLPPGIDINDIMILSSIELWQKDPEKALIEALKRCGKIDENEYLHNYKDVASSGLCPITHYIKFGYKEKRVINIKKNKDLIKQEYRDDDINQIESSVSDKIKFLENENKILNEKLILLQEELEKSLRR